MDASAQCTSVQALLNATETKEWCAVFYLFIAQHQFNFIMVWGRLKGRRSCFRFYPSLSLLSYSFVAIIHLRIFGKAVDFALCERERWREHNANMQRSYVNIVMDCLPDRSWIMHSQFRLSAEPYRNIGAFVCGLVTLFNCIYSSLQPYQPYFVASHLIRYKYFVI